MLKQPDSTTLVTVLMGGPSSEREVSLVSGAAVVDGLRQAGYTVCPCDVRDLGFVVPEGTSVCFVAMHGAMGEDGVVQRRLEELGLPYVGSRSHEMPKSFDKEITKALLAAHGLPTAPWEMLCAGECPTMAPPFVLKAPRQGSSIGVAVVRQASELPGALEEVRAYDDRILVEQYVPGREFTVGVLGGQALPVVEVVPAGDTYDFHAKYRAGTTKYLVPAPVDSACTAELQELALQAFNVLGGRHFGRVDFRVNDEGSPFILELNPIPGFTPTSLLPKAAAAAGIGFSDLCARILGMAE